MIETDRLQQRASNFAMTLAAVLSVGATSIDFSDEVLRATLRSPPQFATFESAATGARQTSFPSENHISRTRLELDVAGRLLPIVDGAIWATSYLDGLRDTLEQLDRVLSGNPHRSVVNEQCGPIATRLEAARLTLLDVAPNFLQWSKVARAIDPNAKLVVPKRFITPPRPLRATLDPRELDDASWLRCESQFT